MAKQATRAQKKLAQQKKEQRFVMSRKVARVLTCIAGALALVVAINAAVLAMWVPAVVFLALTALAFYLAYAMSVEIRSARG